MHSDKKIKPIEEINSYYNNLGIKTYWTRNIHDIIDINRITNKFDELHSLYPNVEIKEIGYSNLFYEKYREAFIEKHSCPNRFPTKEFYERMCDILTPRAINSNSAFYKNETKGIYFNYKVRMYLEKTLIHEFGHVITCKYNFNEDYVFEELFNEMSKEDIKNKISEYASMNIYEFIAEGFAQSFVYPNKNEIITRIRHRIDCFCNAR